MDRDDSRRAHHDLGGVSRFMCETIDKAPHVLTDFDRDVDALRQVLAQKGMMTVDELRRGIESIPEEQYHALSYYRRWIRSIADTLVRRGIVSETDLARALERAR
jgi:hypothetical protein